MHQHALHHHHDVGGLVEQAVSCLRAAGERITPVRRDMLEVLAASSEHLSADEVVNRMAGSKRMERAHRTTVYRTLERFDEVGVVVHRRLPGGAAGYHLSTESHLHGHCVSCQKVVALPAEALDDFGLARERLAEASGFDLSVQRSTLFGFCNNCRKRRRS